jgi:hypothetical protein
MFSVHSKPNDPNRIVDSKYQRQSEGGSKQRLPRTSVQFVKKHPLRE